MNNSIQISEIFSNFNQNNIDFIILRKHELIFENIENNDILDLENVRGKIVSDLRDTIFIVSDFAQYNSVNLNSKFYKNVIINYQDKQITCDNFNINMETNKAIAYNNVVITDPKSIMTAGIVEFDLKTKNININPKNNNSEIEVITK